MITSITDLDIKNKFEERKKRYDKDKIWKCKSQQTCHIYCDHVKKNLDM